MVRVLLQIFCVQTCVIGGGRVGTALQKLDSSIVCPNSYSTQRLVLFFSMLHDSWRITAAWDLQTCAVWLWVCWWRDSLAPGHILCLYAALCMQALVKRGESVPGEEGPIIIATRNDALAGIVENTPENRREGMSCCMHGTAVTLRAWPALQQVG